MTLQNAQSILQARKRAEDELVRAKDALEARTSELANSLAMLRATLESTTDGVLVTDGSGRITGFNERLRGMWDLPVGMLSAGEHPALVRWNSRRFEDPQQFIRRVDEIYASGPPETFDLLELTDGRVFERFSRILFVDGQKAGRVWSHRDITEQRRAHESLREQSEWLRITLSSIGDAVITTDTQGCVTSLNPVAESLTGWKTSDAQGVPLDAVFRIVNEQSREPVDSPAKRALREGRIVGLANHTILIAKDGAERAIDDSAAPIKNNNGTILG
ncbi:MAG: PAS domain S-box protein, partial [Candidatus Eisenbacteria bacterium]